MRQLSRHAPRPLLVCLDLQRAYLAAEPVRWAPPRHASACEQLLGHARRQGWSVVHVHRLDDGAAAEAASLPIPGFEPLPSEPVFLRRQVSALTDPRLAELAQAAREGEILLAGSDLRVSGLATAIDAFNRGLSLTLVRDAFWTSPLAGVEPRASEDALWGVLAPFARVTRTDKIFAQAPIAPFSRIANDR